MIPCSKAYVPGSYATIVEDSRDPLEVAEDRVRSFEGVVMNAQNMDQYQVARRELQRIASLYGLTYDIYGDPFQAPCPCCKNQKEDTE